MAEVNTLHVEIRALMVGKKQFTISMFKQLYEEDLFAINARTDEVALRGEPWGIVHYGMDSELANPYPHGGRRYIKNWIIWQFGNDLHRCPFPDPRVFDFNLDSLSYDTEIYTKINTLPQLFIAV